MYNAKMQRLYQRLTEKGKPHKVAPSPTSPVRSV